MIKGANPIGYQEDYLEAAGHILICHPNLVVKTSELNREELGKLVHHVFLCICRLVSEKNIYINAFSQQLENFHKHHKKWGGGGGGGEGEHVSLSTFLLFFKYVWQSSIKRTT